MINKLYARFIVLLVFAMLTSCSRKPENMVSFVKNFNEIIQTQQNLIFTFNQDIVDAEKIGDWDSVEYIKFSPEVKGRFRWSAVNELVFSPAKKFAPSTNYEAELTKEIFKKAKNAKLYLGDEYKHIKFHTAYLSPQELSAFWAKGNSGSGVVIRLGISFNFIVNPKQL